MPPKKTRSDTHDSHTAKCAITGAPKARGTITPEEMRYARTCKSCGWHVPPEIYLRGKAGIFICDHCDDDYYDPEIREDKDNERTVEFLPPRISK